ncbi:hypothetical protein EJP02_020 [Escherichia phage EJP2]|nr:hypothetical protein EJP02_020 [Escherichia phage EJP2]
MRFYNKFLRSLDGLTNDQMIQACKDAGLEMVGRGSSRVVYAINDKLVIKIALNSVGITQNKNETKIHFCIKNEFIGLSKYFARVYPNLADRKDITLVMERVETKFKGRIKYSTALTVVRFSPARAKVCDIHKAALKHLQAVSTLDEYMNTCNATDLHAKNIGINDKGQVKILDYGFSPVLRNKYFHGRIKNKKEVLA